MKETDFVGKKFNKLTAIVKIKKKGRCWYLCKCDCGKEKVIARMEVKFWIHKKLWMSSTRSGRLPEYQQASP